MLPHKQVFVSFILQLNKHWLFNNWCSIVYKLRHRQALFLLTWKKRMIKWIGSNCGRIQLIIWGFRIILFRLFVICILSQKVLYVLGSKNRFLLTQILGLNKVMERLQNCLVCILIKYIQVYYNTWKICSQTLPNATYLKFQPCRYFSWHLLMMPCCCLILLLAYSIY